MVQNITSDPVTIQGGEEIGLVKLLSPKEEPDHQKTIEIMRVPFGKTVSLLEMTFQSISCFIQLLLYKNSDQVGTLNDFKLFVLLIGSVAVVN